MTRAAELAAENKNQGAGWRCVVNLPGGRCIDVADPRNGPTDETDVANARLIAAAPCLLAACQAVQSEIGKFRIGEMTLATQRLVREALAKATGDHKHGSET